MYSQTSRILYLDFISSWLQSHSWGALFRVYHALFQVKASSAIHCTFAGDASFWQSTMRHSPDMDTRYHIPALCPPAVAQIRVIFFSIVSVRLAVFDTC